MTTAHIAEESGSDQGNSICVTVCVCVCTYKRPELLKRSLSELLKQDGSSGFTYSVVVVDNDKDESARATVLEIQRMSSIEITYCVEPEQNIALARNRAVTCVHANFVAFMDDDEFPARDWLSQMLQACQRYQADGVLGPVRPYFDETPPEWLLRGKFCERPEHPSGTQLHWKHTRTGNAFFHAGILNGIPQPFRREFGNGGEDQDFFRRMMEHGRRFVWCNEAVVFEVVPPQRRTKRYFLKRALQRGQNEKILLSMGRVAKLHLVISIAKSILAIPTYLFVLPLALLLGQHVFIQYAIRLFDHVGKLCAAIGVKVIRGKYLNE